MHPSSSPFSAQRPRLSLLASAVGMVLASSLAHAQDPDEILVIGQSTDPALSSKKFTGPVLDTPKSVTVIPQALIEETGSTSLVEALRTVPGITFNAGEGGQPAGDNLKIRGFDAGADVFIDGVRDAGSQTRDVFALEQIEVVKGPGSAYSGRGSSGGSVNLVTKKPRAEDFLVTQVGAGSDAYGRVALDANYRFGDSAAFRLNALRQAADVPGRDGVSIAHTGLAPSLAFGLGRATRVNLDWYRYETDDVPDYSIPYGRNAANTAPAGEPVAVDRTNFYGLLDRDFQRTSADVRTLQVAHDFGPGLALVNTTRYGSTHNDYIVTNPDDGRGNVPSGFVLRSAKSRNSHAVTMANLTDFSGSAETGRLHHAFAFGVEVGREEMSNRPYVVETLFAGNAVTDFANSCSTPGALGAGSSYNCTTLASPNPHDPWTGTITPSDRTTSAATDTRAVYAFDTLSFNERWSINLGVRLDDYATRQDSFARDGTALDLANDARFLNHQAGVVFKPRPNASFYVSTGTSSTPSGNTLGDGTENLAKSNQDLEPQRDRTYELGTKWALLRQRLSLTSAVFRTETSNARASVASGVEQTIGEERVDGFEIGLSGAITARWHFTGSYGFLDSEIVDDGPLGHNEGNAFPNTPRSSLSAWTTYELTPRATIGGGASFMDARFGNAENTVSVPGYWRYDAMAAFKVATKINLQINVQNLTDEVYFVRPYRAHYASIGPARSVVVSATLDF